MPTPQTGADDGARQLAAARAKVAAPSGACGATGRRWRCRGACCTPAGVRGDRCRARRRAHCELDAANARIAELEAQHTEPHEDHAAQEALADARTELAAAQARIAEFEALDMDRVGADIAHQTLVSLQQEDKVRASSRSTA